MKTPPIKRIDLEMDEVKALLERARASMAQEDYAKLEALVETAVYLLEAVEDKRTTIDRLRKLLFGPSSEKRRDVIPPAPAEPSSTVPDDAEVTRPIRPGHGRHGADAYDGAEKIVVPHESLKSGDRCPDCRQGKVYEVAQPGVLVRVMGQAAQGEVLHNDDTPMKILELMGKRARTKAFAEAEDAPERAPDAPKRTGVFTSGIVSTRQGRRIALFFTGRKHAGENLAKVLAHRAAALGPPIQMCDALSRNLPKELKTILGHCLAHGRRQFVDVVERFPEQCRYVLEILGKVYQNDAVAREQNLSPEERLQFHQAKSEPLMVELKAWLIRQFEDRLVEPNSALGEAISYMVKHWEKLTLFLRKLGAPLDNNVCERALKKAILHRKNAMFYLTENGAHVGDLFMSLIHTCQLCGANPFDYLTALQRHTAELSSAPAKWMPWNYRETLEPADTTTEPRDAIPHTAH